MNEEFLVEIFEDKSLIIVESNSFRLSNRFSFRLINDFVKILIEKEDFSSRVVILEFVRSNCFFLRQDSSNVFRIHSDRISK